MKRSPYEILGITSDAAADEIKKAYKMLAKKYHPDRYRDENDKQAAEEKMKEINAAYDDISKNHVRYSDTPTEGDTEKKENSVNEKMEDKNDDAPKRKVHIWIAVLIFVLSVLFYPVIFIFAVIAVVAASPHGNFREIMEAVLWGLLGGLLSPFMFVYLYVHLGKE